MTTISFSHLRRSGLFILGLRLFFQDAGVLLESVELLDLYLTCNPFHSLANGVVPAVVVFSLAVGIAIMAIPAPSRSDCTVQLTGEFPR